jgi:hypothetical protein
MIMRDRIKKILKEDNDFDWAGDVNPVSKEDIISTLHSLSDVGYRRDLETSQLTDAIHKLALNENQLDSLAKALYHLSDYSYNEGIDIGNQQVNETVTDMVMMMVIPRVNKTLMKN